MFILIRQIDKNIIFLCIWILQYNCNSGGWKNIPSDKQVCEFTPNTLVNCEIRARRESNSNGNKNSEIATDSGKTCNSKSF